MKGLAMISLWVQPSPLEALWAVGSIPWRTPCVRKSLGSTLSLGGPLGRR